MNTVFVVQHAHELEDGAEDVKFIGVYSCVSRRTSVEGSSSFVNCRRLPMGLMSRNIELSHNGHEIALSATLMGKGLSKASYKLYIDGKLADKHITSIWGMIFGATIILRGQIPAETGAQKPTAVKAVASVRVFKRNDYIIYAGEEQLHQEWATYGGM